MTLTDLPLMPDEPLVLVTTYWLPTCEHHVGEITEVTHPEGFPPEVNCGECGTPLTETTPP